MDLENLTKDDAMNIVNDSANQYHERLYAGDATVKTAVEKAFAAADPQRDKSIREEQRILGQTGTANEQDSRNRQPADGESEQASGEPTPVDREVASLLSEQWGDAHAENSQRAGAVLRSVFPTAEAMLEFGQKHGLHTDPKKQAQILDLLAKLGR